MTMAKDEPPAKPTISASAPPPASAASPAPLQAPAILPGAPVEPRSSVFSHRALKQFGLFFAGASFLALSTLITRRAIVRKRIATIPMFYTPSNSPVHKMDSDGPLMALEALNLATINTVSFAVMMIGGVGWALDISNIDDLRKMARRHIGPAGGKTDEEAEKELEEWVARVLLRSSEKEKEAQSSGEKG
ncbi:hypothetical protein F5X96DRAFT_671712 [Biscogniauxia mediterranea]|nr:hypothetical protein F5X96DRAFT_671712 [Biscogniauxia mediterranea]